MAAITRFQPLEDTIDDLVRGFFVRPINFETRETAPFRVDIAENDGAYVLRGDLPGIRKEDINVSIDGDTVSISAEVKEQNEVKDGERVLRSERYHGRFQRAFTLDQPVDEGAARARYADGVLELTLPKKAAAQAKRLTIQ